MHAINLPYIVVTNKAISEARRRPNGPLMSRFLRSVLRGTVAFFALALAGGANAQVNVVTAHNDIARTGQNLNEVALTPSNVNSTQFGKLFSQQLTGAVYAQPLYVSQLAIPNKGTHNVVFVATASDMVYAFDADTNGGADGTPLWQTSLLTNTTSAGTFQLNWGVRGTPVIDLSSNTMYLVSCETQTATATAIFRLHALDITTGAEKFGGPVQIQASVPGTGTGSSGGVLTFNPLYQFQRSGLLLLNGVVYFAFSSENDEGAWHGWIFSYNAATLQQINLFCTSANGSGNGIWMGGAGLAAEVNNPAKPYGRMFLAVGNGSYLIDPATVAGQPFSSPSNQYGMSVLDLDLTGGVMTVEDAFTPFNEALLDGQDGDLGSGGPVLLPTQTLASGQILNPLVEIGKSGMIYILDRDNNTDGSNNPATEYSPAGLGGFNASSDQVVQEVQTPITTAQNWGAGVWGTEAYWNNNIYSGGQNVGSASYSNAPGNNLTAYTFVNGVLSATPTSQSPDKYGYPGPTPSVSANGATNGIVWAMNNTGIRNGERAVLAAYDATNLASILYSSNDNPLRDSPGSPVEFTVPTIANGKVYIGTNGGVSIYGLLADTPAAPTPVITPSSGAFSSPPTVTITDALPGATIYYTTDGSMPTSNSPIYQNPFVVSVNETVIAVASITNYLVSAPASATYLLTTIPANPVFSLAAGTYTGAQTLTITDTTSGAVIYYTIDGPSPTTASAVYTQPLSVSASETVKAVAVAPGPFPSSLVSSTYTIQPAGTINFPLGFAQAQGPIQFNGSTDLDDFRLQLTNGGLNEAGSAFYATPVNIQQFTTTFTFQLSNPTADGITFTIQNNSATALGSGGGGLGYATIPNSVAIKFDLANNAGEGPNSTGLYTNGAYPSVPAISLTGTGINLHSGDYIDATLIYNGTTLTMALTDAITLATWSQSFTINIPAIIGGNTAYVGFTGGTGKLTSSQKLTSWLYTPGPPLPNYAAGFAPGGMTLNGGAVFNGSALELTDGNPGESRSAFFTNPVNVQQFVTSFDFQLTNAIADGFTFTIQGNGPTFLGNGGEALGVGGLKNDVIVKFDLFNNAGEGWDSTGLYTNYQLTTVPAIDLTSTGVNLHSGDIFNVQMAYNGATLTVVITDTVTNATATQTYTVNIPAIVGGTTAYVGFTGASGGATAIQQILSWSYSSEPPSGPTFPSGYSAALSQMTLNGGAALNGTRLRLTDGNPNEARSAFFTNPVNVQQFTTGFDFQLTNAQADGFTFTIQGGGPTFLGNGGDALGVGGLTNDVILKFDLYNNAGEGPDSTGLYTNRQLTTVPAIDLTPMGVNLHSGDIFNVQMAYNGATLTVVITDTVTNATATQTYTVKIPAIVGGTTAYVGFTASSGGLPAIQDILNWTYSGGS